MKKFVISIALAITLGVASVFSGFAVQSASADVTLIITCQDSRVGTFSLEITLPDEGQQIADGIRVCHALEGSVSISPL